MPPVEGIYFNDEIENEEDDFVTKPDHVLNDNVNIYTTVATIVESNATRFFSSTLATWIKDGTSDAFSSVFPEVTVSNGTTIIQAGLKI